MSNERREERNESRWSFLVSDDSDYTSDVSYPLNSGANVNCPLSSMFHSTVAVSPVNHEMGLSSSTGTKKPLAFVQPVIRDSCRRSNDEQRDSDPLSYVSQPRKMIHPLTVEHK